MASKIPILHTLLPCKDYDYAFFEMILVISFIHTSLLLHSLLYHGVPRHGGPQLPVLIMLDV